MADTKISDIIVPEVFAKYSLEKTRERSLLWKSGILAPDERLNMLATRGGAEVNVPFFKPLTGEDEVLSDSASLSVANISAYNMVAHVLMRGKAWGVNDLAEALSGDDPMGAIAEQTADWWNQQYQKTLLSVLKGIFGQALASTHVATSSKALDISTIIDAESLLGAEGEEFAAVYMHDKVYYNLKKQNLITFQTLDTTTEGKGTPKDLHNFIGALNRVAPIPMFDGMVVIHEKNPELVSGSNNYTTYLFKRGSVAFGDANAPVPVETDRDKLAGTDLLIMRRHYLVHPYGLSFVASGNGALAGSSPSNAELATKEKWTKVATDDRSIGIVKITTVEA